jgi:hypothetical protein
MSSARQTATSTRVDSTVEMGSRRRGKNTLLTSAAFDRSTPLERVVTCEKSVQATMPDSEKM